MNEISVLILFFMFFSSCNFKNREKLNILKSQSEATFTSNLEVRKPNTSFANDSIASCKIGGDRQLSFKFNVDTSGYLLKSIIVYSDDIPVQIINANKFIENNDFQLIDWNFDGFRDITARYNCGSGGCAYWIWNYSKESGEYYYNEELSEILGLEIDTISKYIVFHYRSGGSEETWDTFQYKNNKLSFVKGLYSQRWNDTFFNTWVKNTRTKIVNDKLVTTVDSSKVKKE